jgi:PDZ domain
MRSAPLLSASLLILGVLTLRAEEPPATVTVTWGDGIASPGVCVDRATWFVSVIPKAVSLDGLTTARLSDAAASVDGKILHLDPDQRLCLIEVPVGLGPVRPVPLSVGESPKPGDQAHCVSGNTACLSTVAGKDWAYRGETFTYPLLRLRVAETKTHCHAGTVLVDQHGDLLAILTCQETETEGEVYAIPAARVRKVVEDMKRHQRSGPVWVGLVFHNESSSPEILEVKADSPAAKAGLQKGDVIISMNGAEIQSLDDLVESIHNLPAGEAAKVRLLRGLEEKAVEMVPEFSAIAAVSR